MLVATAPAKVNLFLGVGPQRQDGYHAVTTVMHTLDLADTLTVSPASGLTVVCEPDIGLAAEDNIVWRAASALASALGREPDVSIRIEKRIPHGAGLGGGSADAAAALLALARLWGVARDDPRIASVAAALGADVPFFLVPGGAALMGGRGDRPERPLPALAGAPVAIVKPRASSPTVAVYRAFDAHPVEPGDPSAVVEALQEGDAVALAAALDNNMERAACTVSPATAQVLSWLRSQPGVRTALVAGSGSAVFALVADESAAAGVVHAASQAGWWAVATRLGSSGAVVVGSGGAE